MSPAELVKCINSVKSLLQGIGLGSLKVGTADSWNLWVNGANVAVVQAADIVLANAFSVTSSTSQSPLTAVLARSRHQDQRNPFIHGRYHASTKSSPNH